MFLESCWPHLCELCVHDLRLNIHIQCCLRIGLVLLRGKAFSHHVYTMRNGGIPKNNQDSVKKNNQFLKNITSEKVHFLLTFIEIAVWWFVLFQDQENCFARVIGSYCFLAVWPPYKMHQIPSNPTRKFKLVFIPLPHFARILSVKEEHKTIFMDQFFRGKSGQFPLITTIAGKNRVSWRLHTLASWLDLPSTGSLLTNYVDHNQKYCKRLSAGHQKISNHTADSAVQNSYQISLVR